MEDYGIAHPRRRAVALVTVCFAALLLLLATASAHANDQQDTARTFHITATDVPSALNQFSHETGIKVLFDSVAAQKFNTKGIDGSYSPDEALTHILEGTDLKYDWVNADTVAVRLKRPTPKPKGT